MCYIFLFCIDDDEEDDEDEAAEIAHDEQRWKLADTDGDNKLNKEEFYNFLNPEDVPHMRDSLIQVLTGLLKICGFFLCPFLHRISTHHNQWHISCKTAV